MGASPSRLNDRVTADSVSAVTLLQFTFHSAQNSAGAARPSTSVPNPRPGRCLAEKPSRSQTVVDGCKRSKALESDRKRSRRSGKVRTIFTCQRAAGARNNKRRRSSRFRKNDERILPPPMEEVGQKSVKNGRFPAKSTTHGRAGSWPGTMSRYPTIILLIDIRERGVGFIPTAFGNDR